jgi:ATP-dependent helicase/nuclease subunit A
MTLFAARERVDELDERKRLIYVACTRAADYLLLSSSIDSLDKPKGDWVKLIANHFDLGSGDFLGQLPSDYERPRVHIAPVITAGQKLIGRSHGPDLLRMLDEAHQLAAEGAGTVPPLVAPIPVNRAARKQFSFSRLTGQLLRANTEPGATAGSPSSDFEATPLLDPRGLGSLTHDVLARIDFKTVTSDNQITKWCEHLAPQFVVHNEYETAVAASAMITHFANLPRGKQLAAAKLLHREIEFLLPWPPNESRTGQYITGAIDCLYQDAAGAWRIVDYKTNHATSADAQRLSKQYELQLYVYAMAVEQALGVAPVELVLQLLRPGIEVIIPWDHKARQRATELVTTAISVSREDQPDSHPPSPSPLYP